MTFYTRSLPLIIAGMVLMSSVGASDTSKLFGNWKSVSGTSIKIHLKGDMLYVYRYKMLTFSGKWSTSGKKITFNYSVLGSKKKKDATYTLKNGFLTLRTDEHANVVLKKQ